MVNHNTATFAFETEAATWSDYKHHNTIKGLVGTIHRATFVVSELFDVLTSARITVTLFIQVIK